MKRILWLDAIKGYGIILVMMSHVDSIMPIGQYLFSLFIPLFYIASGYVMRDESFTSLIKKKTNRLLIPYLVYGIVLTTFYDIIKSSNNYQGGIMFEWIGLIYSRFCFYPYGSNNNYYFMPIEADSTLWFLTSLFLGYICYKFLVYRYFHKYVNYIIFLTYLFLTAIFSYLSILLPWSLDVCFLVAIFMLIGNTLKRSKFFNESYKNKRLLFFTLVVCYILLVYINGFSNLSVREYGSYGYTNIISILLFIISGILYFIVVSWIFMNLKEWILRLFSFFGRQSLRLMCIQLPVLFYLRKIIRILDINNHILSLILLNTLFIAISLLLSYIIGKLIEYVLVRFNMKRSLLQYL